MKQKSIKLLSGFMSVIMLLSITAGLNFTAYAASYSGKCGNDIVWSLDTETGELELNGTGPMYNYGKNLPEWNDYLQDIKSVVISDGVTSVGTSAFANCKNLTSVTLSDTITTIEEAAFFYCEKLTDISIPGSVTSIDITAFEWCDSLSEINVELKNRNYASISGVLYNKNMSTLIKYPVAKADESFSVPITVKTIGANAFSNCNNLTSITISNLVTTIEDAAFSGCNNLTGVTFSNRLEAIGNYAFYECKNLNSIDIPSSILAIGSHAFSWCENLASITIPDSVKSIEDYTFSYCSSLTQVTIPDSVTRIGVSAFKNCKGLTGLYVLNKNCEIESDSLSGSNPVIYGYKDSTAQTFADEHGFEFTPVYCKKHTLVCVPGTPATCTSTGLTDGYYCSVCGLVTVNQTVVEKLPHTYKTTVTKATTTSNGKTVKECENCGYVASTTVIKKISSVKLSTTAYTYNGKVKTPAVTVKDADGKALVKNTDYTVSYAKGRKNVGKYAVKITFKGKYSGSKTLYFTIAPKGTTISSLTAGSKKFTVKWKKQATQTTGYQIQYSTSSSFASAKTVNISKNSTTSKVISKLAAKKKYYVRIRTYKTVNGKKYYSSWSAKKAVTTK